MKRVFVAKHASGRTVEFPEWKYASAAEAKKAMRELCKSDPKAWKTDVVRRNP